MLQKIALFKVYSSTLKTRSMSVSSWGCKLCLLAISRHACWTSDRLAQPTMEKRSRYSGCEPKLLRNQLTLSGLEDSCRLTPLASFRWKAWKLCTATGPMKAPSNRYQKQRPAWARIGRR